MKSDSLTLPQPGFRGIVGVARQDITPPIGIYSRSWGAAAHDTAEGIHRPLTLTAITFQSTESDPPLILVAADLGWWKSKDDESLVRGGIIDQLHIDPARVMFNLSHTHSGPSLVSDDRNKPGGELIEPYLLHLRQAAIHATTQAIASAQQATIDWTYGRCNLATNRDLPDPARNRIICGFNPNAPADDTLFIGRITNPAGNILATIVNYACHPTTLAWENRLISPDFIGAMRQTIESQTSALAIFVQGASGELAPAHQYLGDPAVADKHGRHIAFAALSAIERLPSPNSHLAYDGVIESGAPLALWREHPHEKSNALAASLSHVELALKPMPTLADIENQHRDCTDRVLKERLWRKRGVRKIVGDGDTTHVPLWTWRIGDCAFVAQSNETYCLFQTQLRSQNNFPIAVMNCTNGSGGYLPPREKYDLDIYQAWQSPYQPGSLERVIDAAQNQISNLFQDQS